MNTSKHAHHSERWDWSPKHVRLKFQMFLSVLVFSVASFSSVKSVKLIPLELHNDIPESLVVFGTFLLALYFIVSFYYRSENEISESAGIDQKTLVSIESLNKNLITQEKILSPISIQFYENTSEKITEEIRLLKKVSNEFSHSIEKLNEEWKVLIPTLQKFYEAYKRQLNQGSNNYSPSDSELEFNKIMKMFNRNKLDAAEMIKITEFTTLCQKLMDNRETIETSFEEAQSLLTENTLSLESVKNLLSEEGLKVLQSQINEIKIFRKYLIQKLSTPNKVEKIWLSYHIPLFSSLLIFVVSTVFATGKVFASITT